MSKINRIRITNLNYNGNSIKVDDDTFDLNGDSTLLSLRNGGGKTVLVQMIMSLFVNKGYRDHGGRSFKNYFTTNRPTFIITEWKLDQGQGFFLVGMMVRKCPNVEENNEEDLEMINFTGFYRNACEYDLDNIPIVEMEDGIRKLKNFGACKREFEQLKRKNGLEFAYYNMSQPYQRRSYFSKLREYQINHKEWETIIKKVNLKESGLSELFANAKDEKGLVEKWFLDAIENKLNQEKSKIENFRSLAYKLVKQYRDNQSNIRRKEIIEQYFEDVKEIEKKVKEYETAEEDLELQQSRIKTFIQSINEMVQNLSELENKANREKDTLYNRITRIEHEKISYDIYCMEDEKQKKVIERVESEKEILQSNYRKEVAEKKLCLFQCAALYQEAKEFGEKAEEYKAKINVLTEGQKGNEGEVNRLGGMLYQYYEDAIETCERDMAQRERKISETKRNIITTSNNRKEEEKNKEKISEAIGEWNGKISAYDKEEERFVKNYKADIARNILGEYEEGSVELNRKIFQSEFDKAKEKLAKLEEEKFKLRKEEEKIRDEEVRLKQELENSRHTLLTLKEENKNLEIEKSRRETIMQYLEVSESELDKSAFLVQCLEHKISELEITQDGYKRDRDTLSKEYENLKQGKTIELPEHIGSYMEEQDIRVVYGMEWLKKNGRSVTENEKIVERNPFLPYSILLSQADIAKLKSIEKNIYTNFPIPIIAREKLGQLSEGEIRNIVDFDEVSFWIMFNKHLLNPEELVKMLNKYKLNMQELEGKIQTKAQEMATYREYRTEIANQSFNSVHLKEVVENIEKKEQEISGINMKISECRSQIRENQKSQTQNEENRKSTEKDKSFQERRKEDYEILVSAYKKYMESIDERERCQRRQREIKRRIEEMENTEKDLTDSLLDLKTILEEEKREKDKFSQEIQYYYPYEDKKCEHLPQDFDLISVRGRYEALTSEVTASIKVWMDMMQTETKRHEKKQKEIKDKNKYQFKEEEYSQLSFTHQQVERAEEEKKAAQKEENAAHEKNNSLTGDIRALNENLKNKMERMRDLLDTDKLVPRKNIVDTDFHARLKVTKFEYKTKTEELEKIKEKMEGFRSTQEVMADCEEFRITKEVEQIDICEFSREELKDYQGDLRRELEKRKRDREKVQNVIGNVIRKVAEKEIYQDEFFKKGFGNLQDLTDNVYNLKMQLNLLVESYKGILQKLQVDLENIDNERKSTEETFLDYIKDVDDHMERIDKNSTITVRQRNIKMLKILVPSWEENKEYYKKRLSNYVENFITKGLEVIEEEKNIDELLGKLITTKNLYNEVVGIGNIGIKLYKIEAEREVPITWQTAAVNSGGEGFLSAFVILVCLLSYMRRDETDLFAVGEEGKVLIMDNPFAQTNAEHLLKPLMDMAKKTNTQLICLSGIGGDSVYNRFDNIYVLNVEGSNIRKGQEYLISEHVKGEAIQKLVLSQFETEQLSLF